jgi:hypothetical protein
MEYSGNTVIAKVEAVPDEVMRRWQEQHVSLSE